MAEQPDADADEPAEDGGARGFERHAERLAQALREVIGSHYCGQVTCSIALSRLHDYEREVEGRRAGEVTHAQAR